MRRGIAVAIYAAQDPMMTLLAPARVAPIVFDKKLRIALLALAMFAAMC